MCELLGMSANVPTDICFSFTGLMQRGGKTGPHRDGWGIAFYEGNACRTFHDPQASAESELARLVHRYPIKSRIVLSHIRRATHGRACLENTHPFVRELWGRMWTFAHNGKLPNVKKRALGAYRPVGATDSEHAFCWMLDHVRRAFPTPPRHPARLATLLATLADDLATLGTFNLLLSDARHLFVYCSTRLCRITRRAPFGEARLEDAELVVDFARETSERDVVTVIATRPLTTNERWTHLAPGTLEVFSNGLPIVRRGPEVVE
ncbi:MAG: class II glutamine amidotransferase [Bradymonadia bacterium]|jgi:glutamine amidotransferase